MINQKNTPAVAPVDTDLESAFAKVTNLVETFKQNERHYLSADYQEAEARKDFIDKFFIALGWDVNHDTQTNPYEQEVKVERNVSTASGQRRADYAFHLKPNFLDVCFYVEAKKPHSDIATKESYFQTIRYGWNSDTPFAVLTDFQDFHVLDCHYKPDIDTALNRCISKYHYTDYTNREKFAEIYWLFSRKAVADGALEKRAKELPKLRGKAVQRGLFPSSQQRINDSFLTELDDYRNTLAHMFKNRNQGLDSETITELVQRTLDRLVFIRFLEDKGILAQRLIDTFGDRGTAWEDFVAACQRLDGVYNGIIFKPHTVLDATNFQVDDAVFADICEDLAHINSPYDFNAIPIHILGSIYERFLGKVIVATNKRVTVEEKPEVRKAGGVYYTPEYIVRHIVEQTIGKQIAGKTPEQIAKLRFADIACGSGSFLLGVYDLLLTYHGNYYNNNPDKARKKDCITRDGKLYLSLEKKREILLNNIYGVDIDSQAVEVCQLSLYLKLLQGETTATSQQYLMDFEHDRQMKKLLPSLNNNIVCGNSLFGSKILTNHLFESTEERKLNPISFEDTFPEIMKRGGFDAVIGNPPYVRPHNIPELTKQLLWENYSTFVAKSDLYSCFMERGLQLTRDGGFISFIVPQTWTSLESFTKIRQKVIDNFAVIELTQLPKKVFADATVETCIFLFQHATQKQDIDSNTVTVNSLSSDGAISLVRSFPQNQIQKAHLFNFQLHGRTDSQPILDKIKAQGRPLGESIKFLYGFKTADDEKFIHQSKEHNESKLFIRSADIVRYGHSAPKEYVWYVPEKMTSNAKTARPGEAARFESEKIIVARMGKSLVATYDSGGLYVKDAMLLLPNGSGVSLRYLLGIINSRLMNYFYQEYFVTIDVLKNALLSLPIVLPDLSNPLSKQIHDDINQKVTQILEARHNLASSKTDKDINYYTHKVDTISHQIDMLVYSLYKLTENETHIIEASTAKAV